MFSPTNHRVTSVTLRLARFNRDRLDFLHEKLSLMFDLISESLSKKKRSDASMSNRKVRQLLELAKSNGMTQKDFELACARLRPNTASRTGAGFNGRLWHYYMANDASMSCEAFGEYVREFRRCGWLDLQKEKDLMVEACTTELCAKLGRPTSQGELEARLSTKWLEAAVAEVVPDMPNRARGALMRQVSRLPLDQQAEAAREVVYQLLLAHNHGLKLDQKEALQFGTNLAH